MTGNELVNFGRRFLARRNFLRGAAASFPLAAVFSDRYAAAQAPNQPDESDERAAPGVISRQRSPLNAEFHGAAWSGRPEIAKVEISADGGKSWSHAELDEKSMPYAWRFFEHTWNVPRRSGKQTLMARATDDRGNVQPMERDQDRRNAMINHVQAIEVYVE